MAVQIATCPALPVGASLVGRSLFRLLSEDLGFQLRRVAATFDLPTLVVNRGGELRVDTAARAAFMRARLSDLRGLGGVRAAGAASGAPFSTSAPDATLMEAPTGGGRGGVRVVRAAAMGTPLLAGRDLTIKALRRRRSES